ncbi:sn-glycerol 3-phosphate transport system substrate-binding protein [Streptomyces sp. LBL]|uniref:extracellular solute-binding protein n=1 Tax=Streptomyces sp. LBL TaxID=2940562 RepID=UPI0024736A7D|nr:extracellular solute-binding protein [Streptomyces sp. LBL]MDH6622263.1 sn-glycerol 3-phosphate transport system substrate-binding protein [Streptomyces sp. LBL]
MKKRVLTTATVVAVMAGAAACSSSSSGSTGASAPDPSALKNAKGVTQITIWHGLGAANGVAFEKLIDRFNATNKGKIHVKATYQGAYADLLAKYTAGLRSNSTPTVLLAGDIATGFLTDVKKSIPAQDMAKANPGDLKLDELSRAGRNYYTVDGTLRAVPMNMSTPVLWVNWDLLKKAGISKDTDLSTLDSVVAAAKAVAEKTGQKGFTMPDDDWYIEQLTATAGQDFCTPGNGRKSKAATGITINTGPAKSAITKVADLYRTGVAVDGAPDGSAGISAFQAGKVGFLLQSSGLLGVLKTGTPFDYQAMPFPTSGPKSTSGTLIGGSALWLSNTAKQAQQVAGWKLETFLTSPAAQEEFSHATGYVPINTETDSSATQKAYLKANPNFQTFTHQVQNTPNVSAAAGCVTGAMTAIRTSNINKLQAAFSGSKPVGAALDEAAADAKSAIKTYQEQVGQ